MLQGRVTVRVQPARVVPRLHPLIDAGMVLLIVGLVIAAIGRARRERPSGPSPVPQVPWSQMVLEISGRGLELNGQPVPAAELEATLRSVYQNRPSKLLFLRLRLNAPGFDLASIVGVAKRSGVHTVAVVPIESKRPAAP